MEPRPNPPVNELRSLKPFRSIPEEELQAIHTLMQRIVVPAGEELISESQVGDCFYILMEGGLKVTKGVEQGEHEVLNIISEPGELFGEMSLVEDKPRSAGVVATSDSDILLIPKEGFLDLVNRFPQFTLEVARSISNYLRRTDKTLISALEEKTRRLEETVVELEATRQELLEKERLSILGRMSATVIHDLKNPLTTISGFAQLLRMQDLPKEEVSKYAQNINRQVEQFMAMTQEVLAYVSGGAKAQMTTVEFMPFLQDTLMGISFNLAQREMKMETELLFEGPVVLDPHRFPRVLENLASNAGDAMEPGGVLTVKTWAEGDDLWIEVGDTGHGIEPEVQAHIFEEFYTHGKHRGTGLGLAITHSIVTEHGGMISVESAPGEGTRFLIKIPQP